MKRKSARKQSTRTRASSDGWAAVRRELAQHDRELFGPGRFRRRPSRNDQFFHLWERLLVRMVEALEKPRRGTELAKLETLACELTRAQEQQRLPRGLIEKLVPRSRHGSLHKE